VVGLGNPGKEYASTRHNVGWLFVDYLSLKQNIKLKPGKGPYWIGEKGGRFLIKPTTFVNLSGEAVSEIVERFDINILEELIVVLDDANLPFGKLRLRMKGSSGGHKGLESIIFHLESEEIPRLRIGIGKKEGIKMREWVLSPFEEREREALPELFERASTGLDILWKRGRDEAMQFLNTEEVESNKSSQESNDP